MKFLEFISLPANVIDAAVQQDKSRIIFSLDNYHSPSSTTVIASPEDRASRLMLGCMSFDESEDYKRIRLVKTIVARVDQHAKAQEPVDDADSVMERGSTLRTSLYGVGTLRKRVGQEDHE